MPPDERERPRRRDRAAHRDDRARGRARRSLRAATASRPSRRTCGSTWSSRAPSTVPHGTARVSLVPAGARGVGRAWRARHDRAGRLEPARQRGEVEPTRRRGRGRRARGRGQRARSRARHRRGRRALRLRPLLPSGERARDAGLRPRSLDRPPGRRVARRQRDRRGCRGWRHANATSPCRSPSRALRLFLSFVLRGSQSPPVGCGTCSTRPTSSASCGGGAAARSSPRSVSRSASGSSSPPRHCPRGSTVRRTTC